MKSFKDKLFEAVKRNHSKIILNLDIMPTSLRSLPRNFDRIEYMRELISKLTPNLAAIKINSQHILFDFNSGELEEIVKSIHDLGGLVILDHKLADIGNTNLVAVHKIFKIGFDALTIHPLIGFEEGVEIIMNEAAKYNAGVISVSLMSHPGSSDFFYLKSSDNIELYKYFLMKSNEWKLDGIVIGATQQEDYSIISKLLNDIEYNPIIISPGFGAQGGKITSDHMIMKNFFPAIGRDILYAFENESGDMNDFDPTLSAEKRLKYYNILYK